MIKNTLTLLSLLLTHRASTTFFQLILLFTILLLTLASILLGNQVGLLSSLFYKYMIEHDWNGLLHQVLIRALWLTLLLSTVLAIIFVCEQALILVWRWILTDLLCKKFTKLLETKCDNPDQRIAQDTSSLCVFMCKLIQKGISSPFLIIYYSWQTFHSLGWKGPLSCFVFFGFGLVLNRIFVSFITPNIVKLDKIEGDYRFSHVCVRQNATNIRLMRGNEFEYKLLKKSLISVMKQSLVVLISRVPLTWHEKFFGYTGSILNYLIISFIVFVEKQWSHLDAASLSQLISSSSFQCIMLIYGFTELIQMGSHFADVMAYTTRIIEFWSSLRESQTTNELTIDQSLIISLENVTIFNQLGEALIKNLTLAIQFGEHLLINGPSGCGKSTLIRAIAGLHHEKNGVIHIFPYCMFLPQVPYIHEGCALFNQVTYPLVYKEEDLIGVVEAMKLSGLIISEKKQNSLNLNEILSPGEKQRLAFARIFFHKPQVVFLDEATSAISIEAEANLYTNCHKMGVTYISCGHRPSLVKFHKHVLTIRDGNWLFE